MPYYEYFCESCGRTFERQQAMSDPPLSECPECRGAVHRLITGGAGFIFNGTASAPAHPSEKICSLERNGATCCGRDQRCGRPSCAGDE